MQFNQEVQEDLAGEECDVMFTFNRWGTYTNSLAIYCSINMEQICYDYVHVCGFA